MNFEKTEDRRMLADSLSRYLGDAYEGDARNSAAYTAPFSNAQTWAELAGLGVLMALVPEENGGLGGDGFDILTVFEELGRRICPEPVLPALMAARLLIHAGADVEEMMSGALRYALAHDELESGYALEELTTRADEHDGGWRVSGRKTCVYGGQVADRFLVSAKKGGTLSVFEIAADAAHVVGYGMVDGGGAAEVVLDNAPATLLIADAETALADTLDVGRLALCAEAVGALDHVYAVTLEYLKTRQQFGQPIGRNQALQHRMVDLMGEIEQARSITILAASRMGSDDQSRTVSMAKNLMGRTVKLAAEEAIQLHGGIAMTWEYPISHYAKRLVMIDHQLGDTDYHLSRVMAGYQAA